MGCVASRNNVISDGKWKSLGSRRRLGKSSSFTPLRSTTPDDMHYDYHMVALTSSTYGIMKLLESEKVNEHLVSVIGGGGTDEPGYSKMRRSESVPGREKAPKKWTDMAMGYSRFKSEQLRNDQIEATQPLKKQGKELSETSETETINTWELMKGLDDKSPLASPLITTTISTKESGLELLSNVSVAPTLKELPRSRSLSAVDGLRLLEKVAVVPDLLAKDTISKQFATKQNFKFLNRGSMDFSQRHSGPLSSIGLPKGQVMGFPVSDSRLLQPIFPTVSDGSHEDAIESNLFDPDILATFQEMTDEKTSSDDDWGHVRSSDGEASTSTSSVDDDSPILWFKGKKSVLGNTFRNGSEDDSRSETYGPRRMSYAKVAPVDSEESRIRVKLDPLARFEEKCPPGGQGRVVLYLTSLRGIRKTFEDCHDLKMILQSFEVWIDERDVSMHAEFRQELKNLASEPMTVPRLFIKGHYIGGSDEVRRLHEDGKLGDLLLDLPILNLRQACEGCGDARFVPCPECNGSCKIVTDSNEVARCPNCNENGLIRCPICF